jgi:hypothetical protein
MIQAPEVLLRHPQRLKASLVRELLLWHPTGLAECQLLLQIRAAAAFSEPWLPLTVQVTVPVTAAAWLQQQQQLQQQQLRLQQLHLTQEVLTHSDLA